MLGCYSSFTYSFLLLTSVAEAGSSLGLSGLLGGDNSLFFFFPINYYGSSDGSTWPGTTARNLPPAAPLGVRPRKPGIPPRAYG